MKTLNNKQSEARLAYALFKLNKAEREAAPGRPVKGRARTKISGKSYHRDLASAFWSAGHAAWGGRAWGVDKSLRREIRNRTH